MIKYMYYGEVRVAHKDVDEFISICNDMKVKDLCDTATIDSVSTAVAKFRDEDDVFDSPDEATNEDTEMDDIKLIEKQNPKYQELTYYTKMENVKNEILNLSIQSETLESTQMNDTAMMSYDLLPCSPYTPDWRSLGGGILRRVLTKLLVSAGYKRSGKIARLGVGSPPPGWPEDIIPWPNYRGTTRSGLKNTEVTRIIISLLEAAGLDPATHVQPGGVVEYIHRDIGTNIIE